MLRVFLTTDNQDGKNRLESSMEKVKGANSVFPTKEDITWFNNAVAARKRIAGEEVMFVGDSDTEYLWPNKRSYVDVDNNVVFIAEGAENRRRLIAKEVYNLKRWRGFVEYKEIVNFREWADKNPKEFSKYQNRFNREANLFVKWIKKEWEGDIEIAFEALEGWESDIKKARQGLTKAQIRSLYEDPLNYQDYVETFFSNINTNHLLIGSMVLLCAVLSLTAYGNSNNSGHNVDNPVLGHNGPDTIGPAIDMTQGILPNDDLLAQNIGDSHADENRIQENAELETKIQVLIQDLHEKDKRDEAGKKLVEIGTPAVEPLMALAGEVNENKDVRKLAIQILGKIGDKRAVNPLITILNDPETLVRLEAVKALGQLRDLEAVEPLIKMKHDDDGYIRKAAFDALTEIYRFREDMFMELLKNNELSFILSDIGKSAVPILVQALNDDDLRERALLRLAAIKDPAAVDGLIHALKNKDHSIRQNAAMYLGIKHDLRGVEPLINCLNDEDVIVVRDSIDALGSLGDSRAVEPLVLLANAQNTPKFLLSNIAGALGKIGEPHPQAVELLLMFLNSEDSRLLEETMAAFAQIKEPRALGPIIRILNNNLINDEYSIRLYAVRALGNIGHADAVDLLLKLLNDKDSFVRMAAIEALGKIGDLQVLQPLLVLQDSDKDIVEAVENTLAAIGKLAVEPLIKALENKDVLVQERAIKVLGKIGDSRAIEPLIKAMNEENWRIWIRAAEALGMIGDAKTIEPLLKILEGKRGYNMLGLTSDILAKIGKRTDIEPLIKALYSDSKFVRDVAILALAKTGDSRVVDVLIKAWGSDPERFGLASKGLIKLGAVAVVQLSDIIGQNDYINIRDQVAEVLGQIGDARAVEPLIGVLGDNNALVREKTVEALGNIRDARAVEPLIGVLGDDNALVREKIAEALGRIRDNRAVEPLIKILRDENKGVREKTVEALGNIGDERAVEPLIGILVDDDALVRKKTKEALVKFGEPAVKPLLGCLSLNNNNPEVHILIINIVEEIGIRTKETVDAMVKVFQDKHYQETVRGKALSALVYAIRNSPRGNLLAVRAVEPLLPQLKEIVMTSYSPEVVESACDALNVLLTSENTNSNAKWDIWAFYYSFIENPDVFLFFKDPATPPIFKSETVNSIGFTMISVLKKQEFQVVRNKCLTRIIDLAKVRLISNDPVSYIYGKFLASNLTTLLIGQDMELSKQVQEEIGHFNEINKGPDPSIFEDKEITVKIYFQESMKENIWLQAYINQAYGFKCTYSDSSVRIFQKQDRHSGRILKIIIPRAPNDHSKFNKSIFEDFNEQGAYEVDYLVYNGHAGMGVELEESFKNAHAYFKAPIIQLACCWSKNTISTIQKLFPLATPILTETGAMSLDGLLIFAHIAERLLQDGKNTTWQNVRADIDTNTAKIRWNGSLYFEEKKGNRIFPDEERFRQISDIDGDGMPDNRDTDGYTFRVVREFRNDLNFDFIPVTDRETPEDKASDVIGRFSQYLSDDPFLRHYSICLVNPNTEGFNKGWFWPEEDTQESLRIEYDQIEGIERALISFNIGYRNLSQESLMLMGLVDASNDLSDRFKEESRNAIEAMENMVDIKKEVVSEEARHARDLIGITEEDTKNVFQKLGVTDMEGKERIVNPLRGFLVGMEYIEKKYKLAERTLANPESTEPDREVARIYMDSVKSLYGTFLEKYRFPQVAFEDMIKILAVSENNPTIWYLAYIAKCGIAIPNNIGKMNEADVGVGLGMGMIFQPLEGMQYNLPTEYIVEGTEAAQDPLETIFKSLQENRNAI